MHCMLSRLLTPKVTSLTPHNCAQIVLRRLHLRHSLLQRSSAVITSPEQATRLASPILASRSPRRTSQHTMGRKDIHADASQKYFTDTRAPATDANGNASWKVTSKCSCCHQSWTSITGTKKIAHIACIAGCGIATCPQSFRPITDKEKEALYPMFAAGKRFLTQRASHSDKRGSSSQPTIKDVTISAVRCQVDRLLARGRAAHEQGNIPDKFWKNKSLREALRLLAEAKPMNYTAPCTKRIGGALRLEVFAEVNAAVAEVTEDCDVFTGSSDR